MRLVAVTLLVINIYMAVTIFEVWSLLTYFTNWAMEFSFVSVLLICYCGSYGDDACNHKKTLACVHIFYEIAFAFNLIVVIVYWGVIHATLIDTLEGEKALHMYLVHIFPTISLLLAQMSTDNLYL